MDAQFQAESTPDAPGGRGLRFALFAGAAALLPFLVILLIEIGLRAAGVAEEQRRVFITADSGGDYLALNPTYAARYFQGFIPGVAFSPFAVNKPENTFRVFVLGGSTTAGFPYRFYNGFPGRLQGELEAARFGQRIEVVNLGLSAVNSYTVLDLAKAALDHDPDALVVYAGHNEFYGAFGTGSTEAGFAGAPWLKRLVIALRRTVLYTLAESLVMSPPEVPSTERTLMAQVVRDADIHQDGAVFAAGVAQFRDNMERVLAAAGAAGVPVVMGTLVSNLADQPPLSDAAEPLDAFAQGQSLMESGRMAEAREAFVRARELDGLRFRAPEALNAWIRSTASAPGVEVVDLEEVFRQESPGGIESNTLFTDHLHPNARGYQLMASAIRDALGASGSSLSIAPDSTVDALDQAHADLLITRLLGDYPFTKDASDEEVRSRYEAVLQRATRAGPADSLAVQIIRGHAAFPPAQLRLSEILTPRDTLEAMRSYRSLLSWQPFNRSLEERVIQLGLESAVADRETDRITLAAASRDGSAFALNALAAVRLRQGLLKDAETVLMRSEGIDPDDPVMLFNRARLLVLQGDTLGARGYFQRFQAARGTATQ
ncbi:MAG: hypothetical protein HKN29_00510 [Rhodothermales bacterium]|nr:hypothetical protein [Rhodothermales bacterium]